MLQRALCAAAIACALALPGSAAARTVAPAVRVQGFPISTRSYPGAQITPALSSGPARTARVKVTKVTVTYVTRHKKRIRKVKKSTRWVTETIQSNREWLLVGGATGSNLLSVSATGKVALVATGLLPPGSVPAGQTSVLPTYGSVQTDGHVWLLDYSVSPAPLYAVSPRGVVTQVATLSGDFVDMTSSGNTIDVTDNSGHIDRCLISKAPSASCAVVQAPTTLDGGQLDAIGSAGGRAWFTDDSGELAAFNPGSEAFTGPFGDYTLSGQLAGEASSDPGTIASSTHGYLYVAGGQDSDQIFANDMIREINPRTGKLMHTYEHGLTNVVSLVGGSDGNIWFLDETNAATGAGKIGVLETASGALYEYPLPRGYRLPSSVAAICTGPKGSNTLFFTLQTSSGGHAAVGEVSGI